MQHAFRAVMFLPLLYCSGGCSPPTTDASLDEYFCSGINTVLRPDSVPDQLPKPDLAGMNAANYDPSDPVLVKIAMKDLSLNDRMRKVSQVRDSAFRASLSTYFANREAVDSAAIRKLRPLLDDSVAVAGLPERRGKLARYMRLIAHTAFGNCKDGSYNYWVQYGMVRNRMDVLPPELLGSVKHVVNQHLRQKLESARSGRSEVINLQDVVLAIRGDVQIRQIARRTLDRFGEDYLKYAPDDVLFFLRFLADRVVAQSALPFESAEYRLTDDMAFLVDLIVRELLATRAPGLSYGLVSRGFSDAQPVRLIPYDGGADLSLGLNRTAPLSKTFSRGGIRTNLELSTARGYAGAIRIVQVLEDLGAPVNGKTGVPVGYSGGGEIPGSILPANRRIDIIIRPIRDLPELQQ